MTSFNFDTLPSHHAILVTHPMRKEKGEEMFRELSSRSHAHTFFNQSVLDIETSRNIIAWSNIPYHQEKIALISFNTAGIPAQNALLKVLEEPRPGVRFILLTTHREHLIDTVLSRLHHIYLEGDTSDIQEAPLNKLALLYLSTSPTERMKLPELTKFLEREDEEGRKDREAIKQFILTLTAILKEKNRDLKLVLETLTLASYASDSSTSGKALIEYLSLLLPRIED